MTPLPLLTPLVPVLPMVRRSPSWPEAFWAGVWYGIGAGCGLVYAFAWAWLLVQLAGDAL